MRKKFLKVKVWIIRVLTKMKLIKNVWHQCEIDLARIEGAEMAKYFRDASDKNAGV